MNRITRKTMAGIVVKNKMDKTIVVEVERRFVHPEFKKVVKRTNKFKVHDEKNECQVGDFISLCETRPLSKEKRWRLREIITKAISDQVEAK